MHIDRRLLGWGAFFILAGGIPLAVRAGLLDKSLVIQWGSLWPLLLIGWGIGLLLRRTPVEWLGGAVVAITFGIMGGGLLATGWSGFPIATGCTSNGPTTAFQARTGDLGTTGQVDIDFNCGSLKVNTGDGSGWSLAGSDRDGHGPKVSSTTARVAIEPGFPLTSIPEAVKSSRPLTGALAGIVTVPDSVVSFGPNGKLPVVV